MVVAKREGDSRNRLVKDANFSYKVRPEGLMCSMVTIVNCMELIFLLPYGIVVEPSTTLILYNINFVLSRYGNLAADCPL